LGKNRARRYFVLSEAIERESEEQEGCRGGKAEESRRRRKTLELDRTAESGNSLGLNATTAVIQEYRC
jgi:hypothetical protein